MQQKIYTKLQTDIEQRKTETPRQAILPGER